MGLPDEAFYVPDDVRELYRAAGERGRDDREAWEKRLDAYEGDRAALRRHPGRPRPARAGRTPLPTWEPGEKVATRVASGKVLQALADVVPAARWPAAPTSRPTPAPCSRTTASSPPTSPAAGRCTSASASTPWPRP